MKYTICLLVGIFHIFSAKGSIRKQQNQLLSQYALNNPVFRILVQQPGFSSSHLTATSTRSRTPAYIFHGIFQPLQDRQRSFVTSSSETPPEKPKGNNYQQTKWTLLDTATDALLWFYKK